MKERIKELAQEAGGKRILVTGLRDETYFSDEELLKFAELLIKECAKVQNQRSCSRHGYDKYSDSSALEEHFGIDTKFSSQGGVDWDYLDSQEQPK